MSRKLPVTCIIPCRNGMATIERAVVSALQAGCDQVTVFNDASTDNTDWLLQQMWDKYPKLHVYSSGLTVRTGVNNARNHLIEEAPHGLIIPLDADDVLRPLDPFTTAYEPGVWVYGNYAEHDGNQINVIKGAAPGALSRKNITGVTFLFHKDDWRQAGGYDSDFAYAEDYGFQCALVNAGIRPKYIDVIGYDRYLRPTGNERTARAGIYWTFYHQLARSKYPAAFAGTGA